MGAWWETFFDESYVSVWGALRRHAETETEADGLFRLVPIAPGARVLDAPCGYGRLSLPLAKRGATVVGVDQSGPLLAEAERRREDLGPDRLRYVHQDLRVPLGDGGFDVALTMFSSIGYGTEDDDLAIFRTLAGALRPGGRLFVETIHRDLVASRGGATMIRGQRTEDGTLFVETPTIDWLAGRIDSTWHWCGPNGSGQKSASIRLYTATELARLLERAGLRIVSAHAGVSDAPLSHDTRLGLLAEK